MSNLRKQVIKLAHGKKHLRPYLLPLLKEAYSGRTVTFPVSGWFSGGPVEIIGQPAQGDPYSAGRGMETTDDLYIQGKHGGKTFVAMLLPNGTFRLMRGGSPKTQKSLDEVAPQIKKHFRL